MQTDPCEGFSWNGGLIVLPPEASRIEFRFSSLTYSSSGNIRIAYRLTDLDRNPIQLRAGVHTAFYDRLPKGTYTLEVGAWTKTGTLQVQAPFIPLSNAPDGLKPGQLIQPMPSCFLSCAYAVSVFTPNTCAKRTHNCYAKKSPGQSWNTSPTFPTNCSLRSPSCPA